MTILTKLHQKIGTITKIMEQAKIGLPSIKLISFREFKKVIHTIEQQQKILSPVFDESEVHLYYAIPIVKMIWTGSLNIYIRIQLVNHENKYDISPINRAANLDLSKFDYILTFSLLAMADISDSFLTYNFRNACK